MIKVAYLKCPTGIAGDMCLGALVDLGIPLEYLIMQLKTLSMSDEYQIRHEKVMRKGQLASKIHVDISTENASIPARHLPTITNLIAEANLPSRVKDWSQQIFQKLAIAEGLVHGLPPEKVHFHEVGATDALVDIVGTCIGLDWLGVKEIYCSALPIGGGEIKTSHGLLSVPVPAVVKLWEMGQVPIYDNGINMELVTPTGAAIAVTLCQDFGPCPNMKIDKVGLGAGDRDLSIPNILQIWLGTKSEIDNSSNVDSIAVLETQIDDLNPQGIGYLFECLFAAGALDVFTQGIGMKKSRPGILLTVICPPHLISECEQIIFSETTTLGIRRLIQPRSILSRRLETVETKFGPIRVKIGEKDSQILNIQPEFEDCLAISRLHNLPWLTVYQMAITAWYK